jgi:hypothetical protein
MALMLGLQSKVKLNFKPTQKNYYILLAFSEFITYLLDC